MKKTLALSLFTLCLLFSPGALAQDAVPGEILQRTIFIKAGNEAGTGFTVDFKGKLYIVTAKHVVAALPTSNGVLQIWRNDQWKDYKTVKTIFPSSSDVDIAVLETDEKVAQPYGITSGDPKSGVTLGQQVWFLGYPFGISSRFKDGTRMPFIKRGTMSAIDGTNQDAIVIYIDGFNNPGFSGGPIIYWDFSKHTYSILGVVKGYTEESAKVLINGQHVDTQILVNTGILVAYSMEHAMKAIEESNRQAEGHQ
jgi:S1-C subfamily serine protease